MRSVTSQKKEDPNVMLTWPVQIKVQADTFDPWAVNISSCWAAWVMCALGETGLLDWIWRDNIDVSVQLGTSTKELDQPTHGHRYGLAQDGALVSANRAHDTVLKAGTNIPVGFFFTFNGRMFNKEASLLDQGSIYILDIIQSKQVCLHSLLSESVFVSDMGH